MPDTSLIGTTLAGNFRITGVIGEGGMATVYRGTTVKDGAEVAIKIMNPELAKESRFVRRFRREARAAAMLKHPNTVQILEFGVDQGFVFLAMELLRGFDLAMLLHRERRIPETRAVQIVVQVCRALSAAHEQSIIHRDLKPDNIMLVRQPDGQPAPIAGLSPTDYVKVLDFGIAKILDDDGEKSPTDPRADPITQEKSMLTRVGTIVGTPAYMAPEQGRAESVDARTDLYACGVLLYELITGRVPFTGETPMQVVMRHVNEPPRPPSDFTKLNPELEKLIMRALAKYPSERQQSAEEMAFDLLRLLPILAGQTPVADVDAVKKTLVLDRAASVPSPLPGQASLPAPLPAPRPAAGVPAVPRAVASASGGGLQAQSAVATT
ncbi:MAG: serine/threonine protein kinase, partial [Polyangiaceae bacterium]|nr:serine/threonine protein kinase [Polyangiaceae bacterium]